jgi:hypothetical protein
MQGVRGSNPLSSTTRNPQVTDLSFVSMSLLAAIESNLQDVRRLRLDVEPGARLMPSRNWMSSLP